MTTGASSPGTSVPGVSPLAALPRIDALLDAAGNLRAEYGRAATAEALRAAVGNSRAAVLAGEAPVPGAEEVIAAAGVLLAKRRPGPPREVINAAGVVVHTNLGRAPLSPAARNAVVAAAGYCDLEFDLDSGRRATRNARLQPLLADACGAEAGLAVNNAAAALVLVLTAIAGSRQVLVSRGELVEIGGSFRLPDIMAAAGARLLEVGTTNRTRAADYEAGDDVALILKVHPSNYRISGFTQEASVADLAAVAQRRGVPIVHDVGSGLLADRLEPALTGEPSLRGSLEQGADLVLASGDKLLGGPQAGLLAGRADLVAACAGHPLFRALRLDKLRTAALVETLEAHLRGDEQDLPVWQALSADFAALRQRAEALAELADGTVVDGITMLGGGSAPGRGIPSPVIRLACASADAAARALRAGSPAIVVRVAHGCLELDLRTVPASLDTLLAERLRTVLAPGRR